MKILFLFSSLMICGICHGQKKLLKVITTSANTEWRTSNPKLEKTKHSFFNTKNSKSNLVIPVEISGLSIPFSWDCDLSILNFLTLEDDDYSVKTGMNADSIYLGTKISWSKNKSSLIWLNNKTHKASIDNWYLMEVTDCPNTFVFPVLQFSPVLELKKARTNNLKGIAIIPFNPEIKNIKSLKTKLYTINKIELSGTGYDLNDDGALDVFIHYESIANDGTIGYKRMYLNINGSWVCKWNQYYQECI
ncbi:hypothetical protein [Urechidicola vernalis]|uniref:Uncharacterized protein n=1 Tax=Urechidicola vernalis TaxID=3075600 RepID=A0ABU2Y6H1_9FLAO|nr:hypothetical protein [Urechidicola sp. P050]MDT0553807.1 hypothetical protein [Urechidicola sp. P050]